MTSLQIFVLQLVSSSVVLTVIAKWYIRPRLERLPWHLAVQALLLPHTFRYVGLIFLLPSLVGPGLPSSFAVPAAYGTFFAGLLALVAIVALRAGTSIAVPLIWIFSVVGLGDLVYAFHRAMSANVRPDQFGTAYFIPTFAVPVAVVTHVMILRLLVRSKRRPPARMLDQLAALDELAPPHGPPASGSGRQG